MINSDSNKRPFSHSPTTITASLVLNHFQIPLFSSTNNAVISRRHSIRLNADHPYTIGRRPRDCDFIFHDRRVSKQHCQIFFDASLCKLYILSGVLSLSDSTINTNTKPRLVHEFRKRVMTSNGSEGFPFREASNGVFVNGVEIRKGMAVELTEGDRVSLVCGNQNGLCGIGNRIGFIVERIDFEGFDDEIDGLTLSGHSQSGKRSKRVFAVKANVSKYEGVIGRAKFFLDTCREILLSDDPLSCILRSVSDSQCGFKCANGTELPQRMMENKVNDIVQSSAALLCESKVIDLEANGDPFCEQGNLGVGCVNAIADKNYNSKLSDSIEKDNLSCDDIGDGKDGGFFYPPPGKNFYLNRLEFMNSGSSDLHKSISLPELLHPIETVSRMFIATFTSDITWCGYLQFPNVFDILQNSVSSASYNRLSQ